MPHGEKQTYGCIEQTANSFDPILIFLTLNHPLAQKGNQQKLVLIGCYVIVRGGALIRDLVVRGVLASETRRHCVNSSDAPWSLKEMEA